MAENCASYCVHGKVDPLNLEPICSGWNKALEKARSMDQKALMRK